MKIGCTGGNGTQCHVQLQLLLPKAGHGPVLLGSVSFVLGAGATEAVKVPLNRAGRAALARAAGRRLHLRASAMIAGGAPVARVVTLGSAR